MQMPVIVFWVFCTLVFAMLPASLVQSDDRHDQPAATEDETKNALIKMHTWLRDSQALDFETSFKVTNPVLGFNARGTAKYEILKPNRFRVSLRDNGDRYLFVSDGTTLTIYRPDTKKYAQMEAQDTIVGTMYKAIGALTLQARMVEFFWTVDYLVSTGEDVQVKAQGFETIGGKRCRRTIVKRFEEEWDVWVEDGGVPYVCRLVSRTTGQGAFTTQSNDFTWTAQPSFNSDHFAFTPPKNARKVHVYDLE